MFNTELLVFIAYFLFMLGIGLVFFMKSKGGGEKDYFLGGRKMGAWVSALSAGASDMSAWVLMGLPASVYAAGMGQTWIANGWQKPDGMCGSAWESMSPFVMALAHGGGDFYDGWMKNPKSAMISCNDGFRPVSFYIEALDEDAD